MCIHLSSSCRQYHIFKFFFEVYNSHFVNSQFINSHFVNIDQMESGNKPTDQSAMWAISLVVSSPYYKNPKSKVSRAITYANS